MKKIFSRFMVFCDYVLHAFFIEINSLIDISVPYVSTDPGDCGIACVMMVLEYKTGKTVYEADLIKKYKTDQYYIDQIGWKHDGLVKILASYKVSAKKFKYKSILYVLSQLQKGKPVIVSLRVPAPNDISVENLYESKNNGKLEGHLCVVKGYKDKRFILHDPRNIRQYSADLLVPDKTFSNIFTGNGISID